MPSPNSLGLQLDFPSRFKMIIRINVGKGNCSPVDKRVLCLAPRGQEVPCWAPRAVDHCENKWAERPL